MQPGLLNKYCAQVVLFRQGNSRSSGVQTHAWGVLLVIAGQVDELVLALDGADDAALVRKHRVGGNHHGIRGEAAAGGRLVALLAVVH